jgi:hypothetical protein
MRDSVNAFLKSPGIMSTARGTKKSQNARTHLVGKIQNHPMTGFGNLFEPCARDHRGQSFRMRDGEMFVLAAPQKQ